jgi:SAM-dependent methyltransferase
VPGRPRPPPRVPKRLRRGVFGRDPAAYDAARLPYPPRVYEILRTRCGLGPGTATFEIGPGTGIATRELLRAGADPLTLFEADRRLARYLRSHLDPGPTRRHIVAGPFEAARPSPGIYDLGVAASSFHWLPPRRATRLVARALRPGGWWASWNNHHGDPYRASPFQRSLQSIYRAMRRGARPSRSDRNPLAWARHDDARDRERRLAALRGSGAFDRVRRDTIHWRTTLERERVQRLWASFSDTVVLPPRTRAWFLDELGRVVDDEFGGRVELSILTPIYTARRI